GHPGMPIPGQPSEINLWVRGESDGEKNPDTYIGYSDADGNWSYVYGAAPQGTDWQLMSYPIPERTAYPISLQMVRAYETRAAQQCSGKIWFDDVVAFVPPSVETPGQARGTGDVVGPAGSTDESPLRVAVVSDAQFVARNPESGAVQGA